MEPLGPAADPISNQFTTFYAFLLPFDTCSVLANYVYAGLIHT